MVRVLLIGSAALFALVAVPACDMTTSIDDLDVLCILGACWLATGLTAYLLAKAGA